MTQSLHLGPLELTLILDARGGIEEGDRIFYPATREEWSARLDSDPQGNVPVVVNALLISEGDQHTLVDTGFGEEERSEREENVLDSLAQVGVQPKHIGRVILTHAHGDHCLGNTLRRAGRWLPTFPLAEYVIQEREIAAMRDLGDEIWFRAHATDDLAVQHLENPSVMHQPVFTEVGDGAIDLFNGIDTWDTAGETPNTYNEEVAALDTLSQTTDEQSFNIQLFDPPPADPATLTIQGAPSEPIWYDLASPPANDPSGSLTISGGVAPYDHQIAWDNDPSYLTSSFDGGSQPTDNGVWNYAWSPIDEGGPELQEVGRLSDSQDILDRRLLPYPATTKPFHNQIRSPVRNLIHQTGQELLNLKFLRLHLALLAMERPGGTKKVATEPSRSSPPKVIT